ncbi:MAG: SDR family NAD(P)-dependent oxidoreductase [Parvibaculaceae bacterium]
MISFDFSGKTVLVTGAGRGLGLAIATAFHAAGALVFVNDRTPEQVDAVIARLGEARLVPAPGDLATLAGVKAAVAPVLAHGTLDVVVNNAAVNVERSFDDTDEAHWDLHLAIDLKAPFFIVRDVLPLLAKNKGTVINIASELGLHAIPANVAYVAAKHGLVTLTKAMSIELAPRGIRVNALCPGTMDTELMRDCAEASGDAADYYRRAQAYHPLNRLAAPEEIASFILCLASPAAAYMTGSAIAIDGGSTAGRL